MKTKTIKSLKKEVLVIELPINGYWEVLSTETRFKCFDTGEKLILKNYTLLGKPDEIKEDDVADLVENKGKYYKNYSPIQGSVQGNITFTALESFNSAIEKEIFWENPFNYEKTHEETVRDELCQCRYITNTESKFLEAQLKTFDKSRTLIFIKN
jgi:hypothetical protein